MALAGSGEPPIQFHAHQMRAGESGAREEFEQMLALLVQATSGRAGLVYANPGDWGIDVLVGDLRGGVEIWQAKYFIGGVRAPHHRRQISESFDSAMKAAGANGHTVSRWVLCVPSSMDPKTRKWWDGWQAERAAATGVTIELWDETVLRGLLMRPEAAHVRRAFYHPYQADPGAPAPRRPVTVAPSRDRRWLPGNEVEVGGAAYLLHEDAAEVPAADRTVVWRTATADRIGAGRVRVRLCQVVSPARHQARETLRRQAGLLRAGHSVRGWPRLLDLHDGPVAATLVTVRPPGRTWREAFGPAATPPDRLTAAAALAAAAQVCAALGELHDRGRFHGALTPDVIILAEPGRTAVLRDPGPAGDAPGPYRAAEQTRAGPGGAPGPHTDAYQVAALVHHTLTGHPPMPLGTPPVRTTLPGFPAGPDDLLLGALGADPAGRPGVAALSRALGEARRALSQGGAL